MVLSNSEYNENYFNGRNTGVKLSWGYADIREHGKLNRNQSDGFGSYNATIKKQLDLLTDLNLSNMDVLDIGGCIGNYSHLGKKLGVGTWTVLDLNIDGWCEANKLDTVDTFITGDARILLASKQQFKKNSYDIIFTSQFLECIDDVDLPDLITEMNRISKTVQIHLISTIDNIDDIPSQSKYNLKQLSEWATLDFESGTRIIDFHTNEVLVV